MNLEGKLIDYHLKKMSEGNPKFRAVDDHEEIEWDDKFVSEEDELAVSSDEEDESDHEGGGGDDDVPEAPKSVKSVKAAKPAKAVKTSSGALDPDDDGKEDVVSGKRCASPSIESPPKKKHTGGSSSGKGGSSSGGGGSSSKTAPVKSAPTMVAATTAPEPKGSPDKAPATTELKSKSHKKKIPEDKAPAAIAPASKSHKARVTEDAPDSPGDGSPRASRSASSAIPAKNTRLSRSTHTHT